MIEKIAEYYNQEDCIKRYSEDVEKVGLWKSEEFIFKKYFSPRNAILDVGCGAGRTTINLYMEGYENISGVDLAQNLINSAKAYCNKNGLRIEFNAFSATQLPYNNDWFDGVIFSYNGLMCMPRFGDRQKAVEEIYRILKPGGIFIFTAQDRNNKKFASFWNSEAQKWSEGKQDVRCEKFGDRYMLDENGHLGFIHVPSIEEIKNLCESVGFTIVEYVNNLEIGNEDEASHETIFWVVRK